MGQGSPEVVEALLHALKDKDVRDTAWGSLWKLVQG
jgi:hypothetical protein